MIAQVVHDFEARGRAPRSRLWAQDRGPRRPQPRAARARRLLRVGLFVPTRGAAGIWGPSAMACAQLATDEINRVGGIGGREVTLVVVDAASENGTLVPAAASLVADQAIDAVVGMHLSIAVPDLAIRRQRPR